MLQLHLIRTKWYGLYHILRSSQKPDFLKSGQIAIGQNKVFCGASDSIITLQSAGEGSITPIKLLEINETGINKSTGSSNAIQIDFDSSWDNLPTDITSENLRFYRIIYTVSEFNFAFTSLSYGLGKIYLNLYGSHYTTSTVTYYDFGSSTTGALDQSLLYDCNILATIDDSSTNTVYYYKHTTSSSGDTSRLSSVMGQPYIIIAGSSSSTRYTVSGYFKYAVYGII